MTEDQDEWTGKTALICILKNGNHLTFTAKDIKFFAGVVSFTDKMGVQYAYPLSIVTEIRGVKP